MYVEIERVRGSSFSRAKNVFEHFVGNFMQQMSAYFYLNLI